MSGARGLHSVVVSGADGRFSAVFLCRFPQQCRHASCHVVPSPHAGILCQRQTLLCPPALRSTFCRALILTPEFFRARDLCVLQGLVTLMRCGSLCTGQSGVRGSLSQLFAFPLILTRVDRRLMRRRGFSEELADSLDFTQGGSKNSPK